MPKKDKKIEEKEKTKSIWHGINEKIKKGIPLSKTDIEPIEYYITHGSEILRIFGDWIDEQKGLIVKHEEKLGNVKARLLAEVL